MPSSESLIHMHALLESDYAISMYILHFFALCQRWSPRGHIFKSLASKPQVLENCPVLGSRNALFFEWLKFCRSAEKKIFSDRFFGDRWKRIFKDLFS